MIATSLKPLTGKHILVILSAFFGVMFAVNMLFVFFALHTFNGGEGGRAYQAGLEYNLTIAAAREQDRLGWSQSIDASLDGEVRVAMTDSNGSPVRMLAVSGEIARPVAEQFTRTLAFNEIKPGIYVASAGPLDAGNWMVTFAAHAHGQNEPVIYRARKRLWLKSNS
jgi:nitrogen fixation protein FixH